MPSTRGLRSEYGHAALMPNDPGREMVGVDVALEVVLDAVLTGRVQEEARKILPVARLPDLPDPGRVDDETLGVPHPGVPGLAVRLHHGGDVEGGALPGPRS